MKLKGVNVKLIGDIEATIDVRDKSISFEFSFFKNNKPTPVYWCDIVEKKDAFYYDNLKCENLEEAIQMAADYFDERVCDPAGIDRSCKNDFSIFISKYESMAKQKQKNITKNFDKEV